MDGDLYIGNTVSTYVSDVRQLDFAFHHCPGHTSAAGLISSDTHLWKLRRVANMKVGTRGGQRLILERRSAYTDCETRSAISRGTPVCYRYLGTRSVIAAPPAKHPPKKSGGTLDSCPLLGSTYLKVECTPY
jgi:hypothetical protein